MNQVLAITILLIFFIFVSRIIIKRTKRAANIKAGKKWDGIVKELSERK
tara:strand:+ start:2315 stop:2461 length:147 start_codon:yes stop_codon:yes gene_type:complete